MTTDALKQQIQSSAGKTFSLAAGDLGVTGVQALITAHLGGTLQVNTSEPGADGLSLTGTGTIDSLQNRPIQVWFSTDSAGANVTGILIACQSADWTVTTSFLQYTANYLSGGSFTSLALSLSARPEDNTDTTYGVGVGAYVNVNGQPMFLHAQLPADEQANNQTSDIILTGAFDGVTLGNLNALAGFATGYTFDGILPSSIPLADNFLLRSGTYVINPQLQMVVALGLDIRSAKPWVIVEQMFEFDFVDITFLIPAPGTGKIDWVLSAELDIGETVTLLASVDSNENLDLELVDPVPIQPLLNHFAPSVNLDLTVDRLEGGLDLSQTPPYWSFNISISSTWTLFNTVTLDAAEFSIAGQGGTVSEIQINATLAIGDASLYIGGAMNQGAGWDFTGRLAHEYDVQLQPDPDFVPGTSTNSLVSVPVNNNVTHFLGGILDSVFPGGSGSGVPAMLDLNIKTLSVEFNTQTNDFHFNGEIDFGANVATTLTFASLHQKGATTTTFEKRATGVITVFPGQTNEFAFALGIDLTAGSKHFVGAYSNTSGQPIQLGALVQALFPNCPVTPPNFSITLKDAIVGYVSTGQTSQTVFALDMGVSIDLSGLGNIPLIGQSLSAAKSFSLAFQIVYPAIAKGTSFAKADLAALNGLIAVSGPQFPADSDLTELFVKSELRLGDGNAIDFSLPVSLNAGTGQLQPDSNKPPLNPPNSTATDDGVKWIQLNKTFGPFHLQRAGFKFDGSGGTVTALLDGGVTAFGLEVDLVGLSVTTKVTDLSNFSPQFDLQGLGISFSKGSVDIAAAFLHLNDEYDGLATVQAGPLRLGAIGSLAKVQGQSSLFIYAVLDYPIGGVPAFYVTGLSGGFGLNRQLLMPPVDQVSTFPLIAEAINPPQIPTDAGSAGPVIANELQKLDQYLPPSVGQYFACAGIRFTSFELLDSFVVLAVSFGREFELDLLGLTTLVVPPKQTSAPALAVVALQIKASFIPDQGIVIVQGQLTSTSYILDPNCHLTGGFGFAVWFGPSPYAGDFVVTLGGYHPDFTKPSYYPDAPRLGLSWKISTELSVVGGLYFALTPRALMAGGALNATFQISVDVGIASADIKAWFLLGADFIVYWKPFHYSAHVYVDMGIDVTIHFLGTSHLSIDAGADLKVWGPPFSGRARVYFKVIGINVSFNISFGDSAVEPLPLDWNNTDASKSFRESFLPADNQIAAASVAAGFIRKVDLSNEPGANAAMAGNAPNQVWYVVNPLELSIQTNSTVPIKTCESAVPWADGQKSLAGFGANTVFGIAPMSKGDSQVATFHRITITRNGVSAEAGFAMRPIQRHVPGGLWAQANSSDVNAPSLIENAAVGFEIVCGAPPIAGHTSAIQRELLAYTTYPMQNAWTASSIAAFGATIPDPGDDPAGNSAIWNRIQTEIHLNPNRDAIFQNLGIDFGLLDIGEDFTVDSAFAPLYGVLAS